MQPPQRLVSLKPFSRTSALERIAEDGCRPGKVATFPDEIFHQGRKALRWVTFAIYTKYSVGCMINGMPAFIEGHGRLHQDAIGLACYPLQQSGHVAVIAQVVC